MRAVPKDEIQSWIEKKRGNVYSTKEEEKLSGELLEELDCLIDDTDFEAFDVDDPPERQSLEL